MNTIKRRLTIPDILKAINESNDLSETVYLENQLACVFASPIMFMGFILQTIAFLFVKETDVHFTLVNAAVFFVLGILFEILLLIDISVKFKAIAINILYALWFIFAFFRLFHYIGPAIWTLAYIQIIFAMSRIKKDMIVFVGTVTILACIFVLFDPSEYMFRLNTFSFIPQAILTMILIVLSGIVHKINADRHKKLNEQFQVVIEQKNDITALCEEISAAEEELRHQNEQIKESEEILYEMAYFDSLTRLPNRKMFMENLDNAIQKATLDSSVFYLVYIDLDYFKKINDTLGHLEGDAYIQCMAQRLSELVHKDDFVGRLGGDEFALIIRRNITRDEVMQEIEAIKNGVSRSIKLQTAEIQSTASFGISIFPRDGRNSLELLKHADMSMYKAKESKNSIKFYEPYMQDELMRKMNIEKCLMDGIRNREFTLVFQPQVLSDGKSLRGIETLVRWNSPELGPVSPMDFIPIAEETGLIVPLGKWILETACQWFVKLQERYNLDICLSVNISPVQIKEFSFTDTVKNILDEIGLNPGCLELEITESVFIDSINQAVPILNKLKALGVQIALDDFGTGFSSLSYLKLLPIDTLKIDKSFIDDLTDDPDHVSIVEDIISLGHKLGIAVVAEGVEYSHQLNYLKKHSCDCIQGYLFSKPLDEYSLENLLAKGK